MSNEFNDLFTPEDLVKEDITQGANMAEMSDVTDVQQDMTHASISSTALAYGAYKAFHSSAVQDWVSEAKESFKEKVSDVADAAVDYIKELGEDIKDFSMGVYDSVKSFFTDSKETESKEFSTYSKEFSETREFGLDRCAEAAKEYFNPGVIADWMNLTDDQRAGICYAYADEVAKAFELENYGGVIFEDLGPGVLGSNNGDGTIHLTTDLLNPMMTPLNLIDTITHELRHQYQSECVAGLHDVADEVRNEWAMASQIYTTEDAWCYDPWGYMYNPLEIDSRYAGETVVREITSQMFNDVLASA